MITMTLFQCSFKYSCPINSYNFYNSHLGPLHYIDAEAHNLILSRLNSFGECNTWINVWKSLFNIDWMTCHSHGWMHTSIWHINRMPAQLVNCVFARGRNTHNFICAHIDQGWFSNLVTINADQIDSKYMKITETVNNLIVHAKCSHWNEAFGGKFIFLTFTKLWKHHKRCTK